MDNANEHKSKQVYCIHHANVLETYYRTIYWIRLSFNIKNNRIFIILDIMQKLEPIIPVFFSGILSR